MPIRILDYYHYYPMHTIVLYSNTTRNVHTVQFLLIVIIACHIEYVFHLVF